jgi:microcystin-dependent protein
MRWISWNFAPKGWALANGQLMPINQNQALFSLLGTTYGGDGRVNFALPDLRGRVGVFTGGTLGATLGEKAGTESVTINQSTMPQHNHLLNASSTADGANVNTPSANFPANSSVSPWRSAADTTLAPNAVTNIGGSQPHENRSPFLVLNCIIALQGTFPSQN